MIKDKGLVKYALTIVIGLEILKIISPMVKEYIIMEIKRKKKVNGLMVNLKLKNDFILV